MLVVFSPIFVAGTKITFRYNFVAPLVDDNQIISQDENIFMSIPILNMPTDQEFQYSYSPEEDSLLRIIGKYQNHPSIKLIKSKNKSQTFRFRETNIDKTKKSIENLYPKKASQKSDMNTNIIRENAAFLQNICVMISMLLYLIQNFIMS